LTVGYKSLKTLDLSNNMAIELAKRHSGIITVPLTIVSGYPLSQAVNHALREQPYETGVTRFLDKFSDNVVYSATMDRGAFEDEVQRFTSGKAIVRRQFIPSGDVIIRTNKFSTGFSTKESEDYLAAFIRENTFLGEDEAGSPRKEQREYGVTLREMKEGKHWLHARIPASHWSGWSLVDIAGKRSGSSVF